MAINLGASGPTQSDLYVQQLAATNPQLFNTAFGNSSLTNQLGSSPGGILNNPAYGGFSVQQSLNIAQSAEGLFEQGLSISPLAQQLNQQSQIGFLQEQQRAQQQQILQQQILAGGNGILPGAPGAGFGGQAQQPLGIDLSAGPQAILQQLVGLLTSLLGSFQQGGPQQLV